MAQSTSTHSRKPTGTPLTPPPSSHVCIWTTNKGSNPCKYHPHLTSRNSLDLREEALRHRHMCHQETWSEHTKLLPLLKIGDRVRIQTQTGSHPMGPHRHRHGSAPISPIPHQNRRNTQEQKIPQKIHPHIPTSQTKVHLRGYRSPPSNPTFR